MEERAAILRIVSHNKRLVGLKRKVYRLRVKLYGLCVRARIFLLFYLCPTLVCINKRIPSLREIRRKGDRLLLIPSFPSFFFFKEFVGTTLVRRCKNKEKRLIAVSGSETRQTMRGKLYFHRLVLLSFFFFVWKSNSFLFS